MKKKMKNFHDINVVFHKILPSLGLREHEEENNMMERKFIHRPQKLFIFLTDAWVLCK
jgi:hypothetical protein